MKQETLKDKKFQQKLVDKLNNGELSYQNAPIYTILLDLVQGNSVDEVYRVFCEVIKEQNNNKYSEEDLRNAFDSAREFNSLDGVVDVHIVLPMGGDMSDLQPLHFTFEEWFEQFKKKIKL